MKIPACLLGIALLFTAGCIISRPLTDPETAEVDEQLLGHWKATTTKNGEILHLFIGKHSTKGNPDTIIEIISILHNKSKSSYSGTNNPDNNSSYKAFGSISRIGKSKFINIFCTDSGAAFLGAPNSYELWVDNEDRSVIPMRYIIDENRLTLYGFNHKKAQALQAKGDLVVKRGKFVTANIVSYIRTNGDSELFTNPPNEELVFSKVED